MVMLTLTAELEPTEGGLIQARLVELPGVITVGRSRRHALEQLVDALQESSVTPSPSRWRCGGRR